MPTTRRPSEAETELRQEETHDLEDAEQDAAEAEADAKPLGDVAVEPDREPPGTVTGQRLVGNKRRDTADGHADSRALSE